MNILNIQSHYKVNISNDKADIYEKNKYILPQSKSHNLIHNKIIWELELFVATYFHIYILYIF